MSPDTHGDLHAVPARRLPATAVLAAYLDHLTSVVGLIIAGTLYATQPQLWPGPLAWVVIAPLLLARLGEPLLRWLGTRVALGDDALDVTTTFLTQRRRSIRWDAVRALDIDAPWAFRALGLARVTVAQSGEESARLVLAGVDRATVDLIRARMLRAAPEALTAGASERLAKVASSQEHAAPTAQFDAPPAQLVYRATTAQLAIAGLSFGQFAVVAAGFGVAAWGALDDLGLTRAVLGGIAGSPLTIAAAVLVLLAAGLGATLLRFAGFEVLRDAEGHVVVRYGAIERHERRVQRQAIVGLAIRRNPVEMLLGRTRLVLITADSSAELGVNLVLPSLPDRVVRRILVEAFPEQSPPQLVAGRGGLVSSLLIGSGTALIGIGAGAAPVLLLAAPPWVGLLTGTAAFAAVYALGRLLATRLEVADAGLRITATTRHISLRQRVILGSSIHLVETTAWMRRPRLVRAHYYAGMPRALTAVRFVPREVEQLSAQLSRLSPRIAAEHRRRLEVAP